VKPLLLVKYRPIYYWLYINWEFASVASVPFKKYNLYVNVHILSIYALVVKLSGLKTGIIYGLELDANGSAV
jgi:hypothetical protein